VRLVILERFASERTFGLFVIIFQRCLPTLDACEAKLILALLTLLGFLENHHANLTLNHRMLMRGQHWILDIICAHK
jgi:hypothetical protein